jgi:hypothetical protein
LIFLINIKCALAQVTRHRDAIGGKVASEASPGAAEDKDALRLVVAEVTDRDANGVRLDSGSEAGSGHHLAGLCGWRRGI